MRRLVSLITALVFAIPAVFFLDAKTASAAATMSISAPSAVQVGENVNLVVNVNTGGQSANAFDATLTYSTTYFTGVRATYSGSICTLQISDATPSGGSAQISCGRPSGYNGSGLIVTVILQAKAEGTSSIGLSGCSVLANDGLGTDITGGCSGKTITNTIAPTPPPTPTPSHTPTPSATPTPTPSKTPKASPSPKASASPTPTPTPGGSAAPTDTSETPPPTPPLEGGALQTLPSDEATPTPAESAAPQTERRSIGQAFQDMLSSFRDIGSVGKNSTGLIAILVAFLPMMALAFGTVFIVYRLYLLERRRRRTLDRLFEMELSELAALEGKLDLLSEKGGKGKEQFKEEFQAAKANILRQIKPDYGKPVEEAKKAPAKDAKDEKAA